MAFDEGDTEATGRGVERATHTSDPSTYDEHVEDLVRTQSFDGVGSSKTHSARLPTSITNVRRGFEVVPRSALAACAITRVADVGTAHQTPATR